MRNTFLPLLLLFGLLSARADTTASIGGPVLGYFWEPATARLRPILGIPGSSLLGKAPSMNIELLDAEVSPRQEYALGIGKEAREAVLVLFGSAPLAARSLDFWPAGIDRIFLSPTGTTAALLYPSNRMFLISGLPDTPQAAGEIDLSDLGGSITGVAVSDRDSTVLVAAGGLFSVQAGRAPRFIAPGAQSRALAFFENSLDAVAADSERNEVLYIRDVAGAGETLALAGERDGISDPVAVAAAGQRIFVANRGANTVAILGLDGAAPVFIPSPGPVAGLHRLRGEAVFGLSAPSARPMFLLDAGRPAEPQVLFVPGDAAPESRPTRQRRLP